MWELFWFFLGVIVYKFLSLFLEVSKKAKFVSDIKNIAFLLVGQAFEELTKAHMLKYWSLSLQPNITDEQIKIYKNEDQAFLHDWKRMAVNNLNNSVPLIYHTHVKVEDWKHLTDLLMVWHDKSIQKVEKNNIDISS